VARILGKPANEPAVGTEAVPERVEAVSSPEEKAANREMKLVGVDMPVGEILRLDEADVDLAFDSEGMPELSEDETRKLGYENRKAYLIADGRRRAKRAKARENERQRKTPPQLWVKDPFDKVADRMEKLLRKRVGWHQTWIRNDQFDDFMEVGYAQVRRSKEGSTQEPGTETGEVIKITESDRVILIQVECPIELYEQGIKANAYRSQVMYSPDAQETFREQLEGRVNRDMGTKKERISVINEFEEGVEKFTGR